MTFFSTAWRSSRRRWWREGLKGGGRCNAGSIAQTPNWKSGRSRYGLNHQERGSNKQRFVWIATEILCVCVLCDASMKKITLVYYCRTMYQSRTFGLNTFNTSVLRFLANFLINQVWLLEDKMWKKGDKQCSSQWCPWAKHMKTTWQNLERYFHELTGMCTRMHFLDEAEKCSKQRIHICANEFQCHHPQQLCASQLYWKSCKFQDPRNFESMDSLSPRLPPKSLAKVFGKFDARARRNMLQTKWRQDPKSMSDSQVFHVTTRVK